MIIYNSDNMHLVLLPKKITLEKFLSNAKVRKGSYFSKVLESIYIGLTSSTTDLEKEYKDYYTEYDTFNDFLYHKYPKLDNEKLKLIDDFLKSGKYTLLRGYMLKLSDYNLQTIMVHSDDFIEIINKLLKAELYEN